MSLYEGKSWRSASVGQRALIDYLDVFEQACVRPVVRGKEDIGTSGTAVWPSGLRIEWHLSDKCAAPREEGTPALRRSGCVHRDDKHERGRCFALGSQDRSWPLPRNRFRRRRGIWLWDVRHRSRQRWRERRSVCARGAGIRHSGWWSAARVPQRVPNLNSERCA